MKIGMDKTCAQFSGPPRTAAAAASTRFPVTCAVKMLPSMKNPVRSTIPNHAEQWRQPFLQLRQFESMVFRLGLQALTRIGTPRRRWLAPMILRAAVLC